jgi:[ribosomal protein S5]-alanine N-acetyltransferase
MPQPELKTERLILRPFTLDDALAVKQLAGDPAIADTTLNIPHPYADGMAESWIETHAKTFARGGGVTYAITRRDDGTLVGAIGLTCDQRHDRAEMGYWVGQPYWGQGYATEAARALLSYGFTELGLNKICANHFERNPASGRVMQKVGMGYEGLQRQHVRNGDQYEDLVTYGILRSEFAD